MVEDSLGRAVAVVALQPIAERLADQHEREEREAERQRAEQEAAERVRAEREARISSGLATPADLDEIAREASSEIAIQDPSVARQIWARLVASGAVGTPTHDVLEVHVKGKNSRLTLTELSRAPAWLASNAGTWEGRTSEFGDVRQHQMDVWVDGDGTAWAPHSPRPDGGGLELSLSRQYGAKVNESLMVILPHEMSLRTHRDWGKKYPSRLQLVGGVIVRSDHNHPGLFNQRYSLRDAVVAILKARGLDYPPAVTA